MLFVLCGTDRLSNIVTKIRIIITIIVITLLSSCVQVNICLTEIEGNLILLNVIKMTDLTSDRLHLMCLSFIDLHIIQIDFKQQKILLKHLY